MWPFKKRKPRPKYKIVPYINGVDCSTGKEIVRFKLGDLRDDGEYREIGNCFTSIEEAKARIAEIEVQRKEAQAKETRQKELYDTLTIFVESEVD